MRKTTHWLLNMTTEGILEHIYIRQDFIDELVEQNCLRQFITEYILQNDTDENYRQLLIDMMKEYRCYSFICSCIRWDVTAQGYKYWRNMFEKILKHEQKKKSTVI